MIYNVLNNELLFLDYIFHHHLYFLTIKELKENSIKNYKNPQIKEIIQNSKELKQVC